MTTNLSRQLKKLKIKARSKSKLARVASYQQRLRLYRTKNRSLRHSIKQLRAQNTRLKKSKSKLRGAGYRLLEDFRKEKVVSNLFYEQSMHAFGRARELQNDIDEFRPFVPRRWSHRELVRRFVEWLDWNDPFLP